MRRAKRINHNPNKHKLLWGWYFGMDFYVVIKTEAKWIKQTKYRKSNVCHKQEIKNNRMFPKWIRMNSAEISSFDNSLNR